MINLRTELALSGFNVDQVKIILEWVNTLTNKDLEQNGSKNACFPPGDGDYEELPDDYWSLESRVQRFLDENIQGYKDRNEKLHLVRDLHKEFELTLVQAKNIIDQNW